MSIGHLVQNELVERFLSESSENLPDIPVEIFLEGDSWTTVIIHSITPQDEANVLIFLNSFEKLNN
jgi:hypothetical protein